MPSNPLDLEAPIDGGPEGSGDSAPDRELGREGPGKAVDARLAFLKKYPRLGLSDLLLPRKSE